MHTVEVMNKIEELENKIKLLIFDFMRETELVPNIKIHNKSIYKNSVIEPEGVGVNGKIITITATIH